MQKWGKVVSFKPPMGQVAAGRASSYTFLIHIKQKLIVGADMHDEVLRRLLQFHDLAEMKHERIALRPVRTSNPLRRPGFVQQVRINWKVGLICGIGINLGRHKSAIREQQRERDNDTNEEKKSSALH